MHVLVIGGTGLISTGIVTHLLARGAQVTMFNRGQRQSMLPAAVKSIVGDRNSADFASLGRRQAFDAVIDMICFTPQQAEATAAAFGGRCRHLIFCSTVCTYGVKIPPGVLVDESFTQEPISQYGRDKLASERILRRAADAGQFELTIIRPSSTYGPGGGLIDNLEFNPVSWDRIERGLPVLCAGDGLGLWQSTFRDDVGKLFAYATLNPRTYGKAYNATRDKVFTWRDYFREAAGALGKPARLLFMPAGWIVAHDPRRFGFLREISQFHGAYNSAAAKADVSEFRCEVDFPQGAAQTLADIRRRGVWRSSADDAVYQSMVDRAIAAGVEPVEA